VSLSSLHDADVERRLARRLLEVLIRATFLLAMALLCYRVLAPSSRWRPGL